MKVASFLARKRCLMLRRKTMDNKYTPVELTDIFPDFDSEKFATVFNTKTTDLFPKKTTLDFLLEGLSLPADIIKNQDVFLRNYIYCTVIARKHLLEIDDRLKIIKQRKSFSYLCRSIFF